MGNKFRRTLTGLAVFVVVLLVVYLLPLWAFAIVTAGFIGSALFELFLMVEKRGIFVYKYFGTVVGVLIPMVILLGYILPGMDNLEPLLIMLASIFVFILQFLRKDGGKDHLVSISVTLFAILYIGWFFSFLVKLRELPNGANLTMFLILITKGTDVGAYFGGSRFGRRELIPRISPKKTKEGTAIGVIFSALLALTLGRALTGFSALHVLVVGVIIAVIGQIGDLAESLLKRDCGLKDSGVVLGEIGGMFDVIDSLLFTAPVFYLYVKSF